MGVSEPGKVRLPAMVRLLTEDFLILFRRFTNSFLRTFRRTLGSERTYTCKCTHVHMAVYACTLASERREVHGKESGMQGLVIGFEAMNRNAIRSDKELCEKDL